MKKITLTLLSAVAMLTAYGQNADTTIVLNYGEMGPVDTITISKSSATFIQLQEAENLVKGITNYAGRHRWKTVDAVFASWQICDA